MSDGLTVEIGGKKLAVWPDGQKVTEWGDPYLLQTTFTDTEQYHPGLIELINRLEPELREKTWFGPQACGTKIYNTAEWNSPAADFLTLRAQALFRQVRKTPEAHVDFSWASAYRNRDFCPPHSHLRAFASIVYMLDPGDADPADESSGQFWISDPRIQGSCGTQPGCMTNPVSPAMVPGTMLIFPGEVVHNVWPYNGKRLRITMSWNINPQLTSGGEDFYARKVDRMGGNGQR